MTVPRRLEAASPGAAAEVEATRRTLSRASWGVLLVIATELTLFGSLIASYFYLRFRAPTWPPDGVPDPEVLAPVLLTLLLLASVVPIWAAVRSARAGQRGRAWLLLSAGTAMAGLYLGLQIGLFIDELHRFSPTDNAYGSIYFTLLGLDHVHVVAGLCLNAWLLLAFGLGLTNHRFLALRVAAFYWSFVAAIGVLVVLTQIYPVL